MEKSNDKNRPGKRYKIISQNLENIKLPRVAIIGRPNVGKSTLFNKMVKHRKAIIDPTPGVTRDLSYHEIKIKGRKCILVDTGGITTERDDAFKKAITDQASRALNIADIIIFMVEISGISGDDEEIRTILQKFDKPVILAVNKVDSHKHEENIHMFYELGIGEPVPLSATTGYSYNEFLEKLSEHLDSVETEDIEPLSDENEQKEQANVIKVAIVGKPNVGKSSLLNSLLGYERSIVSDVPGTTRDSIEERLTYKGKTIQFVDTAGIRRKSKVDFGIEFFSIGRAIYSLEKSDVILHLIDVNEGLSDQDKKIMGMAMNRHKCIIMVLSKWDLVPEGDKALTDFKDWIRFRFAVASYMPIISVSSLKNIRMKQLLDEVINLYHRYDHRAETSVLNKKLELWTQQTKPPARKGKINFKYITQVKTKPPTFILNVNKPFLVPDNYRQYIVNRIRTELGFSGIPIKLVMKSGRENDK